MQECDDTAYQLNASSLLKLMVPDNQGHIGPAVLSEYGMSRVSAARVNVSETQDQTLKKASKPLFSFSILTGLPSVFAVRYTFVNH